MLVEHNLNFDIRVIDDRAAIVGSSITAAGSATASVSTTRPTPGSGISFEGRSRGVVADSTVSGSFAAGTANRTGRNRRVQVEDGVILFGDGAAGLVAPQPRQAPSLAASALSASPWSR